MDPRVPAHWRQGDAYMYRVLAKLDRTHTTAEQSGLSLHLVGVGGSAPIIRVTANGSADAIVLPKVGTPDARGCTIITEQYGALLVESPRRALASERLLVGAVVHRALLGARAAVAHFGVAAGMRVRWRAVVHGWHGPGPARLGNSTRCQPDAFSG
ncbi:hypothetical protein [Streptomyces sp. NPDC004008]